MIDKLDSQELKNLIPFFKNEEQAGFDLETIAARVNWRVQSHSCTSQDGLASIKKEPEPYWDLVQKEIVKFLCTNDETYEELHQEIRKYSSKATTTIVSIISAAFSSVIGVSSGVIIPLCALALYTVTKVGISAYCELNS